MTTRGAVRTWPVLLAAVVAAVLLAGATTALILRSRHTVVHVVTHRAAPSAPLPVQQCGRPPCVTDGAPAAMISAVLHSVPATVVDSYTLSGPSAEQVVAAAVRLRTADEVVVGVLSRCVISGASVPTRIPANAPAVGPATVFVVVAGRGGCSVAVTLEVPANVRVPLGQALSVARDPAVVLAG